MNIIKARKLVYEYYRRDENNNVEAITTALDHVDLDVKPGQFIAILGHNGSGKSTLAKHISALLTPVEGTLWVDGMDTSEETNQILVRQNAGIVFQNPDNQLVASVVEEDVAFGPENLGVPSEEINSRVEKSLAAVGMSKYRMHSPNRLSGGQKQRIAIAGIMAMEPKCIVFDEPTAMLDPHGRREVLRTAHELNRQKGITVILITHYMEEVIDVDYAYVMEKGKIVMDGTPRQLFSHVDELKQYRLDVPQVTLLADKLRRDGMDIPAGIISNEEFIDALMQIFHRADMRICAGNALQNKMQGEFASAIEGEKHNREPENPHLAMKEGVIFDHVDYIYSKETAYRIHALKDINLSIEKGEFVGIIGHTGSGKSTLVQHLNGLLKATSGHIYVSGEDIYDKGYDFRKLRSRVGLVFQYPEYQLFENTVFADVCFGPTNQNLDKKTVELRAYEALKQVNFPDELFYQSPLDLSGGQKRRVAIAGVLAMKPEVLILDEPTSGLDPAGRDEILSLISKMHQELGITILLVSHSMEDVAKYVDRILVMNDGQLAFDGAPKEVFAHYKELEEMELSAPQITYLVHGLAEIGLQLPLDVTTVEEAELAILRAINQG